MDTYKINGNNFTYAICKNKITEGGYSTVHIGKCDKMHTPLAIKKINKMKLLANGIKMLSTEIEIVKEMMKHTHPNVVSYYDIIDEINTLYIVMEYCDGGDLSSLFIKIPLKYEYVKYYFSQIVNALKFLTEHNIIHRDIKPKNILLTDDKKIIKLCDFGFAKHHDGMTRITTMCGSPLYMAPEIYKHMSYTRTVDIWALGLILYEMLYGYHPLSKYNDPLKLANSVTTDDIFIPLEMNINNNCIDLLKQMLTRNSSKRIDFENLFQHPWILECNSSIIENFNINNLYVDDNSNATPKLLDQTSTDKSQSYIFNIED